MEDEYIEKRVVRIKIEEKKDEQQKKVWIPSDSWSWRKYGQKLLKGSLHPKGYYRCSTTKGCSAKKQVERCKEDASFLIITYTSTHNHPSPSNQKTSKKKAQLIAQTQIIEAHNRPMLNLHDQSYQGHFNLQSPTNSPNEANEKEKQDEEKPYLVLLDTYTPFESQYEQSLVDYPHLKSLKVQEKCDFLDAIDDLDCF
ncbi:unnamed protein product [Amaranthus hypochondriacus]